MLYINTCVVPFSFNLYSILCFYVFLHIDDIAIAPAKLSLPSTSSTTSTSMPHETDGKNNPTVRDILIFLILRLIFNILWFFYTTNINFDHKICDWFIPLHWSSFFCRNKKLWELSLLLLNWVFFYFIKYSLFYFILIDWLANKFLILIFR